MCELRKRWIAVLLLVALSLLGCDGFGQATPLPTNVPTFPTSQPITNPPTPVLPSPTPPPISAPLPTATYDATLDDWTILVYMDADNNLELPGLLDLNEMEAAGSSEQVNVIVQVDRALGETNLDGDWSDTRRYRILPDADRELLNSEPLQSLGEQNMGDPAVLADFISWGIQSFPANRYALIIWDHGAGWSGIAYDGDAPTFDGGDHISLPDLQGALEIGLAEAGVPTLDVIGFDACLMGQLDVFQAVRPFTQYAVGSGELTPGLGWDYESLLRTLYANPAVDGRSLASSMVSEFLNFYTAVQPDDFVTMSAVELSQLDGLTLAVEGLANALTVEPAFVASAVGDARSGAATFARVYPDSFEQYAAIDLHHFASILAQRSPDDAVVTAAKGVMTAVNNAVIANGTGAGLKNSQGVAIYFPRNGRFYDADYSSTTQLTAWDAFLQTYHAVGQAELPPPFVNLSAAQAPVAGLQNPAFINFQVIGRDVDNVALIAGRYLEDGRQLLLEYDHLNPEPTFLPDGSEIVEWRDGVHDDFYVWETEVTYLYDSFDNGDFVVMWPTEPGSTLFTVQGRYRRADGNNYVDANLVFDHRTASLTRVWTVQSDATDAPAELLPQPGDEFQLYTLFYTEDGIEREPGSSLFFDDNRDLYFEWRPLPDGRHFFGFQAENVAGETAVSFIDLTVDNSVLTPGYEAYLDPYLGFQFLYPEAWFRPRYQDTLLYTSQQQGSTQFQVTIYPNLDAAITPETLKAQTLQQFGAVDTLFENEVLVAGQPALRTVYGYNKPEEGERTGIFLTFVDNGTGFVVDVDGLSIDEATTQAVVQTLANSWTYRDVGIGLQPGRWPIATLDGFTVAQPATFAYQQVGSWEWFGAGVTTFVALRTEPTTLDTLGVVTSLVRDAGADVQNFEVGEPYEFPLGGLVWLRVDFSYEDPEAGTVWGFLMARVEDEQDIVAWVEAPASQYNQLENSVFLTMIADLALR
ncbi:clostripain-related cysteine peptidase [Candidatus Leptofilum sp.]|uniref:clostripain-related cysteine peptidase n=1 Tax=Candidatus Leptofilum sp. TaxID=3241576 RepID=UPI003B5CBC56